jgi:glycosyltransferase involved in cell wall biosynthesis
MAGTPELSIIIPVYNPRSTLRRTLESCVSQDVDSEIIIVDDGSQRVRLIHEIRETYPQIKLVTKANGGIHDALNAGHDAASGEWRIKIDDDDWFTAGCLTRMLNALDGMDHQADYFAYGDTFLPLQRTTHCPGEWSLALNDDSHRTWYAIMWHSKWWGRARYWKPDELPIYHEDWDFVRQLECAGVRGLYVPGTCLNYVFDPDGNSLNNLAQQYSPRIHEIIQERFG